MKSELHATILDLLEKNRIMTLATNRPDGWPHATSVSYVNKGLELYCFVSRLGQKYFNLKRDPRVSVTVTPGFTSAADIKGLSLAAHAVEVNDKDAFDHSYAALLTRYPEYVTMPKPYPALTPLFRMTPKIISVLDYSKGFGHSDQIEVGQKDLAKEVVSTQRSWL